MRPCLGHTLGMRAARLATALVVVALVASPATAASSGAAPKEVVVHMKGMAFIPDGARVQGDVTINVGDTVTWVYSETATDLGCATLSGCPGHTSTSASPEKKWDSKLYGKDVPPSQVKYPKNRFSVRFEKAGTFAYVCTPHATLPHLYNLGAGMKAKVIVK